MSAEGGAPCAGGRTCPATGLPLPSQVRLRAAPELQRRIRAWAAEHGLVVPPVAEGAPASAAGAAGGAPGAEPSASFLGWLGACARRLAARLRRVLDEAPLLYPSLVEEDWGRRA